jgi:type I restriction enzyme S subunit
MAGEWSIGVLADLCDSVDYGYTASAANDPSVGPKFLRITDIRQDGLRWDDVPHVEIPADKFEKYSLRAGDIVVARTGAFTGANAYVVPPVPAVFASYLVRLKAGPRLDSRFAYYFMQSGAYRDHVAGVLGGSAQPNASAKALTKVEIPLPPLPEQRRIAAILSALDDKIELNRKMNRTLEEMAQALFKSWFIDFDGHDDLVDSEIGPVPRGWRAGALADVAEITMGQSPPGSTYNEWGGGLPFFQGATDFGAVFPTNRVYCTAPSRFADNWDVLISVRAPVGRTNLAVERCAIGRGVASIRSRHGRHPAYMWCLIHSLSASLDVYNGEGTVFGSINKNALHALPVIVAPTANIDAFEGKAGPLLSRLRLTDQESRTLATLRDTLLPKLISGELRVPEAEAAVAEAL